MDDRWLQSETNHVDDNAIHYKYTQNIWHSLCINNINNIVLTKVIRRKKHANLLGCDHCEKVCNGLWAA